ncbi:SGT1 domain-containing protein [Rozella allomycis CSF55]|uniref:SGT1 domain-containing protein n=1 Tax=Rozella allomycis (strain CSF55) TaxID=988480 RepID=A0A075AUR7_ROZAC|nr:SGT1 domain-containing protein [Rozella allomycis CSF55]|eukprot:EPZ32274.1 SGT1 domain-containing protein [Rozella allomycis CSF55]
MAFGKTNTGESIDDETLIAKALTEFSKQDKTVIIEIQDNDGQFLLVDINEDILPGWLIPDEMDKRVYIHNGQMHLIPIPSSPSEIGVYPSTVNDVTSQIIPLILSGKTVAQPELQQEFQKKINGIENTAHKARVLVPNKIAYVLNKNPQLISFAVDAFCNRDPSSQYILSKMKHFPQEEVVETTVPVEKLPGWSRYLMTLNSKGYFQNEMIESEKYKILLAKAKDTYLNVFKDDILMKRPQPSLELGTALSGFKTGVSYANDLKEDSDDWLDTFKAEIINNDFSNFNFDETLAELSKFMEKESGYEGIANKFENQDEDSDDEYSEDEKYEMDEDTKNDYDFLKGMLKTLKTWEPHLEDLKNENKKKSEDKDDESSSDEEYNLYDKNGKPTDAFYDLIGDGPEIEDYQEEISNNQNGGQQESFQIPESDHEFMATLMQAMKNEPNGVGPVSNLFRALSGKK